MPSAAHAAPPGRLTALDLPFVTGMMRSVSRPTPDSRLLKVGK
jgi:hypothetical protein